MEATAGMPNMFAKIMGKCTIIWTRTERTTGRGYSGFEQLMCLHWLDLLQNSAVDSEIQKSH